MIVFLLGVQQINIDVNKMNCDTASYKQERYAEIANAMKKMLVKVDWKRTSSRRKRPPWRSSGVNRNAAVGLQDCCGSLGGHPFRYVCEEFDKIVNFVNLHFGAKKEALWPGSAADLGT